MRTVSIIVFGLLTVLAGCKNKNEFQISIESNRTQYDTIILHELVTGRVIANVPLNSGHKNYEFNIDEATLGSLSIDGTEITYLTIIRPGISKSVVIDSTSIKTHRSISDSLVNYLWTSTNQTFSKHGNTIFSQDNPQRVKSLFDSLIQVRSEQLLKYRSQLSADEFGILDYQNKARAYSFLMFYGRIIKRYAPEDEFFSFISNIDNESIYSKSLPDNILYKNEILMLRQKDSIENISSFLSFIESQTTNKDLESFLKAIYLQGVIEHPSYWRRHENLFNTNTISEALQRESKNKYSYLITKASNSFYASQKGVEGYDFTAFKLDGTEFNISELKGKLVVIDVWATWCGPCIEQRPNMLALAKKYKDHPGVVFLMVSVDTSVDRWKKYATQTNENSYGIDVNIPDGMHGEFGDNYLIKSIPKYILLDKNGIIIDSNLPEPSIGLEQLIEGVSKHY